MLNKTSLLLMSVVAIPMACAKQQPVASPDAGPRPSIRLRIDSPRYLETNVPADREIRISYMPSGISPDEARQWIFKNVVIEDYPTQKAVQGSWTYNPMGSDVVFRPPSPWAKGDYIVRFPNLSITPFPNVTSYVTVSPKPYNLFRVSSSAPRLSQVELLGDKSAGSSADLVRVVLRFSETLPSTEAVTIQAEQAVGASWVSLGAVQKSQTEATAAKAIDPSSLLRFTVSSPSLDGKWTGIPGSGPLSVEFKPNEHMIEPGQVEYYVVPNLSIELPSGVKKP